MPGGKPLLVGLTGGIGAGKSVVGKIFQILGSPVYNSDLRARSLMNTDPIIIEKVKSLFGQQAYENGLLNRPFIAGVVFHDTTMRTQLNEVVHPVVADDFKQWVKSHSEVAYLLKEAALLFENGSYQQLDQMITVSAPVDLRLNRVMKRDPQRNKSDILGIMDTQWKEEKKIELSDYVVDNSGAQLVIPQVLSIHQKLINQVSG